MTFFVSSGLVAFTSITGRARRRGANVRPRSQQRPPSCREHEPTPLPRARSRRESTRRMAFVYGNIYEGEGRRRADAGDLDTDSDDDARASALRAPEPKCTMTAVTVKPTAGVSKGQLVVKSVSGSSSGRDRVADRGGGGGIGVVHTIRPRPKSATGGGGIMGPPRQPAAKPERRQLHPGKDGGVKMFATLVPEDKKTKKKAGVKYVPSVRKQRPAPPPQPHLLDFGDENTNLEWGEDDDDVLCRRLPSHSSQATFRLGGKHVNKSSAAAHASGSCCCAHERRYMLGSVEKVRSQLLVVQTSMAKALWWGGGGARSADAMIRKVDATT